MARQRQSPSNSPEALSASASVKDLADGPVIAPADLKVVQTLLWALKPLVNLRGHIPLRYFIAFLMVALDEGKGVCAYARAMGIHRGNMSRCLRDIGDRARDGGPGLGLVKVIPHPSPLHGNDTRVILTAKGRALANEIFKQIRMAGDGTSSISKARRPPAAA